MNIEMLVDGKAAKATGDATFTRMNPYTGKPATTAPAATVADAIAAADAAAAAFPAWSETPRTPAARCFSRPPRSWRPRPPTSSKPPWKKPAPRRPWVGFNVHLAAGMLREAAAMTTQITGEVIPSDKPGTLAMGIRQPAGVVLGIAPWNAPVILGTRAVAMPLACGNTVVLKASELCPATHRLIGSVLAEAGLPDGRGQCGDQRAARRRRGRRGADRPSRRPPRQLHRLDPGRQDHRRDLRAPPQAGAAGTRRQGALHRPAKTPISTPRSTRPPSAPS